jgi:hypothetical protein
VLFETVCIYIQCSHLSQWMQAFSEVRPLKWVVLVKSFRRCAGDFYICLSVCHCYHNLLVKPTVTHKRLKVKLKLKLFYSPMCFGVLHAPSSGTTLKTYMEELCHY